ncbi:MAG: aspartate--tRNA ligase, partial [Bacteroidales bacterium]|nr:aspartate--tRNA ligase [Bacteroidales bacterium]
MYRTHTCGELRIADAGIQTTLAGWVQRSRKMGGMTFVDIRDRYGITQIVFNSETDAALNDAAQKLGREYVIQVTGTVRERESKNKNLPTGEIEIIANGLTVLNESATPPFTIEDDTDGGDDLRMKYRYLDLRRQAVRRNMELRHDICQKIRAYLSDLKFLEVETPVLIGSTPEGARDFVVPSRMNPGQFYALPQSPQTLKQLLMVAGFDRYFQIVKCFRDEDLRADRQPEFTQIDCEMSFIEQEDILEVFEGLMKELFRSVKGIDFKEPFQRMKWSDAMKYYGSDKPDLRFGMKFVEIKDLMQGRGFPVFDQAEYIGAICAKGAASYTRKQLDQLTDFVKRPQIGAKGLVYARVEADGNVKSSVDKFYDQPSLQALKERMEAEPGDLILI